MTPEPTPTPGWIARKKRKELRGVHEGSVLGAVFYLPIFERMQSREEVVCLRAEGRVSSRHLPTYSHSRIKILEAHEKNMRQQRKLLRGLTVVRYIPKHQ